MRAVEVFVPRTARKGASIIAEEETLRRFQGEVAVTARGCGDRAGHFPLMGGLLRSILFWVAALRHVLEGNDAFDIFPRKNGRLFPFYENLDIGRHGE